jgi:hypothetical protein
MIIIVYDTRITETSNASIATKYQEETAKPVIEAVQRSPVPPKSKKQKAIPLQAWTGLVGSRRLRLPDFKTIGT